MHCEAIFLKFVPLINILSIRMVVALNRTLHAADPLAVREPK
jgi:hypothetical protein